MKAWVDESKSQGHTLCAMAAGELFVLSEVDGPASIPTTSVPAHLEGAVRSATGSCPEQAIVVED